MQQHLLLTEELRKTMPTTTKVVFSMPIDMVVHDHDSMKAQDVIKGENVIVEDTKENIIAWLKPFDGVWIGNGVPQMEHFEVMHIRDDV